MKYSDIETIEWAVCFSYKHNDKLIKNKLLIIQKLIELNE